MAESDRRRRRRRLKKHEVTELPRYRRRRHSHHDVPAQSNKSGKSGSAGKTGKSRRSTGRPDASAKPWFGAHPIVLAAVMVVLVIAGFTYFRLNQGDGIAEQIAQGEAQIAQGRLSEAVTTFRTLLIDHPESARARWGLGTALLGLEDGAGALKEFEQAEAYGYRGANLFTNKLVALLFEGRFNDVLGQLVFVTELEGNPLLLEIKARAQLGLGQLTEARKTLEEVVHAEGVRPQSRAWLGRVALEQGDIAAAADQVEALRESGQADTQGWLLAARVALTRNNLGGAEQAYRSTLELAPENLEARLGLVRVLLLQSQFEPAESLLTTVLDETPNHPVAKFLLAHVHALAGRDQASIQQAQEVLSDYPRHPGTLQLLATLYVEHAQWAHGELVLRRLLNVQPGHVLATKLMAAVELSNGYPEKAIARLEGLSADPLTDPGLLRQLAQAYVQDQRPARAIELLARGIEQHPTRSDLITEYGFAYLANGDLERGRQHLSTAIERAPNAPRAYLLLAVAELESGYPQPAARTLERLAQLEPDNPTVWHLLGLAALQGGDPAAARTHVRRSLEIAPDYVPALWTASRLDHASGHLERARSSYQALLRLAPHHARASVELAWLEVQAGRTGAAMQVLEAHLAQAPTSVDATLMLSRLHLAQNAPDRAAALIRELWSTRPVAKVRTELVDLLVATGSYREAQEVLDTEALAVSSPGSRNDERSVAATSRHALLDALNSGESTTKVLAKLPANSLARGSKLELLHRGVNALAQRRFKETPAIGYGLERNHQAIAEAELVRGDGYLARGKPRAALTAYGKALEHDPNLPLLERIVHGWMALGDPGAGTQVLERYLRAQPDTAKAHLLMAEVALASGHDDRAKTALEHSLGLNPGDYRALNNLAWIYAKLGDGRALALAEDAYRQARDVPEVADTLGWILVELGQTERGQALIEQALRAHPDNLTIRYHHAVALLRSDQRDQARAILEALRDAPTPFPERAGVTELLNALPQTR